MVIPERRLAWLLAPFAVLAGCGDQPSPVQLSQPIPPAVQTAPLLESARVPIRQAEAPELSPGMRTAMTNTLTAALEEFDLRPDASMSVLRDFFQQVEARQAEGLSASGDLLRTIHP